MGDFLAELADAGRKAADGRRKIKEATAAQVKAMQARRERDEAGARLAWWGQFDRKVNFGQWAALFPPYLALIQESGRKLLADWCDRIERDDVPLVARSAARAFVLAAKDPPDTKQIAEILKHACEISADRLREALEFLTEQVRLEITVELSDSNARKRQEQERQRIERNGGEETTKAAAARCVYLGRGQFEIGGERFTIDGPDAAELEILIENKSATDSQLKNSGVNNPSRRFNGIRQRYDGRLAPYIFCPGGKNRGGYRTTIVDGR